MGPGATSSPEAHRADIAASAASVGVEQWARRPPASRLTTQVQHVEQAPGNRTAVSTHSIHPTSSHNPWAGRSTPATRQRLAAATPCSPSSLVAAPHRPQSDTRHGTHNTRNERWPWPARQQQGSRKIIRTPLSIVPDAAKSIYGRPTNACSQTLSVHAPSSLRARCSGGGGPMGAPHITSCRGRS